MVNGEADELTWVGLARPWLLDGVAEEESKARSGGAEVELGAEGEVHLEVPREEEHSVDGAADREVEEIDAVHFVAYRLGPVGEDSLDGHAGPYAECKVDVGKLVDSPFGLRADNGSGNEAEIRFGPCEQRTSHPLAIFGTEEHHGSRRYRSMLLSFWKASCKAQLAKVTRRFAEERYRVQRNVAKR